jgi:signal transduction histidine kinase
MIAPMATVSGTSLDGISGVAVGRRRWTPLALLIGGLGLCLAYVVLPERLVFVREGLIYVGLEAIVVAAILLGVYWYRPDVPAAWLAIAAGIASWTIGDALWAAYVLDGENPFPSAADAFYIPGYLLLTAGLVIAAARRFAERDTGAFLDAVVLVATVGLLVWVYEIEPLRHGDQSAFATAISIAYPLGDLLLLAVMTRFMVGNAWQLASFRWLAAGIALALAGDVSIAVSDVGHSSLSQRWSNMLILAGVVFIGVAALDPSMRALTQRMYWVVPLPRLRRLVLVALAALLPATVLIVQAWRDDALHLTAIIVATVVTFLAAILRWGGVLMELGRTIGRESTLRRYATELLETSGSEQLAHLAQRTARNIVGNDSAVVRLGDTVTVPEDPRHVVVDIVVQGDRMGELVARAQSGQIMRLREVLPTVTSELALALEREELLETERRNAEQLAAQNEQLRELDKMKDQFVSTVSHELRTPLASMIGYLEVTLDGEVGELNEDQREFLEIVNRNATRLNRLIDDILFMSRFESGRLTVEPSWVSFAELAAASAETARFAAEKRGIEVRCSVEEGLPAYWGDPTRLTQLLDNLISNAIKFTDAGGTVRIEAGRDDAAIRVAIADSGVGIPEDEVGRLFERFFRASTGSSRPGTGLGLSIVQSIAQLHGGAVSVSSELGVGTTFTIGLPLPGLPDAPASESESQEGAT